MAEPALDSDMENTENTGALGDQKKDEEEKPESLRNEIAFFIFGFQIYSLFSLIIAGAQDILMGTVVPTSAVLVANMGPYFVVTLIAPYFIQRIPYFYRLLALLVLESIGLIMIVVGKQVGVKLCGVTLCSFGFGLGELSFIAMTSFYRKAAANSFSAGTGAGISFAPLYYTAMTTWVCISPSLTISIIALGLVLILVSYGIMDRKHSQSETQPASHKHVTYTQIGSSEAADDSKDNAQHELLTWREKLTAIRQVWHVAASVVVAWISEYLIIQSVITTIAFPSSPFPPRDHYQYYIFIFLLGELFGRSYLVVLAFFKPGLALKAICRRVWILAMAEVLIFIFFVLASWFRFLTDVSIALILAFIAGLIIGVMYVNMLALYSEVEDPKSREFVLGYASAATGAGATTAGLLGLLLEPWLREHCLSVARSSEYCFTRSLGSRVCR